MSGSTCQHCGKAAATRFKTPIGMLCQPCIVGLLEQEREEDEPLGEWDEDNYLRWMELLRGSIKTGL